MDEATDSIFETEDPDFGYDLRNVSTVDHPFVTPHNGYFPGLSYEIKTLTGVLLFAYEISLNESVRMVQEVESRDRDFNQDMFPQKATEDLSSTDEYDPRHYSYLDRRFSTPPRGGYLLRLNHVEAKNLSLALEIATAIAPERWGSSSYNEGDIKVGLLYCRDLGTGRVYVLLGLVQTKQLDKKSFIVALIDNNALPLGMQYDLFGANQYQDEEE